MGDLEDTICALSTAHGKAGIAVVRVSGPATFPIIAKLFDRREALERSPERQAVLGRLVDPETGEALDEVLVTRFPAPRSYTGEDVVEVSMHGSPVLVSALLETLCRCGARLAEPGEFTKRAFLRGRMDLVQAEAVRDVIESSTLYQAQVAARQCSGEVSRRLEPLKTTLIDIIVQLESAVEFVEEDLPLESREDLALELEGLLRDLGEWVESFRRGRIVREGFSMAIVGRPNVGKSSLFNALLARERAIVTEIPGTTRDSISEIANLEGIPVRLLDTAGVRSSDDRVEQIGVNRTFEAMADADAILLVVDQSSLPSEEDLGLRERLGALSCIVVMNKLDLPPAWSRDDKERYAEGRPWVEVSALTGANVGSLRGEILRHLFGDAGPERDGILVTRVRHLQCLEKSRGRLEKAAAALRAGLSEEFPLHDLHGALRGLGEITGETTVEDLLGEIFSRFCVGK